MIYIVYSYKIGNDTYVFIDKWPGGGGYTHSRKSGN